jgi:hypothetical protein
MEQYYPADFVILAADTFHEVGSVSHDIRGCILSCCQRSTRRILNRIFQIIANDICSRVQCAVEGSVALLREPAVEILLLDRGWGTLLKGGKETVYCMPARLFQDLSGRGTFPIARSTFCDGAVFTPDLGRISTNSTEKLQVLEQISKFNTSILPDLQQQLRLVHEKVSTLESRIETLKQVRSPTLLSDLDDPEKIQGSIAAFTESLRSETETLTAAEAQLCQETAKVKAELRRLQVQFFNRQLERTKQTLAQEMWDEHQFFGGRKVRRRSNTTFSQSPQLGRKNSARPGIPPKI